MPNQLIHELGLLHSDIDEITNGLDQDTLTKLRNRSVLICGGNGFLGKIYTAFFFKLNLQGVLGRITVLDNFVASTTNATSVSRKGLEFKVHDITKPYPTKPDEKFDYILAAASIASPKVYKANPIETMDVGYLGLKNCLDLAKEHNAKLLFFSSSEVYGTADITPTPETYVGAISSQTERSCYDISKLIGECLVYNYCKKYNLQACTVRPFNFYIATNSMVEDGRVIPSFARQIANHLPLEIYERAGRTRCFTYATDGIIGTLLALVKGKQGAIYNIGNPNQEISISKLAEKCEEILGHPLEKKIVQYPESYAGDGDPLKRVPDITLARKELGFEPKISLEEGLHRVLTFPKE